LYVITTRAGRSTLNPIQVSCPGCQKVYFVRPEDLTPGESHFQCTACPKMFAFTWPQPPGVNIITARLIEKNEKQTSSGLSAPSKRVCVRCGSKVDAKYSECPKCGIIFDRAKKEKRIDPVAKGATPELSASWDVLMANYTDESRHESFIQTCLARENLAFASAQYRHILDGNPSEDIANRMQNKIIELATFSYITAQTKEKKVSRWAGIAKFMILISGLIIVSGILIPQARPMIAVGGSILVFIYTSKYFGRS